MRLKFTGNDFVRSGLQKGMTVSVPTDWRTDGGYVTKGAISEIVDALEMRGVIIRDFYYVFDTVCHPNGKEFLMFWQQTFF